MSETTKVACALTKWAIKEMTYCDGGNPNDTLTSMNLDGICLGPLVDIWSYVEKHVKSESTVRKIRGNIKLQSQGNVKDSKKLSLMSQKEKLQQEVTELQKSIDILHESIQETKHNMDEKEKTLHHVIQANQDKKRTSMLLNLNKNNLSHQTKELNKSIRDIENGFRSLIPVHEKEINLDKFRIDLEKMCLMMQNSLNELVNDEPNMDAIQGSKVDTGKELATLMDHLPHPQLLHLIQELQESETSLKKAVETPVCLARNDEKLNSNLSDDSIQPLQKLLYNLSWFHTQACSQASKAKGETNLVKKEITSLKLELDRQLDDKFATDEKTKMATRQLIDIEMQIASRKAAVGALQRNLDDLEAFCFRSEANQVDIERKIATIEKNSCIADHLSLLICTLARKNANCARALQQSATRFRHLATEDMKAAHSLLLDAIRKSQSNSGKEWELYKQLESGQLLTVPVERKLVPVHRLAIHRLLPQSTKESNLADEYLESTLKHLQLDRFMPVMEVFRSVGSMKEVQKRTERAIRWHDTRQQEIAEKYGLSWLQHGTARYKELAKALQDKRQNLEGELLPSLEARLKKMDEITHMFADIETALTDWSKEPAKQIDTGRLVADQSLEQYRLQWSKSITMCRKRN